MTAPLTRKPLYKRLYAQVLFAIVVGIALGFLAPDLGTQMKPLGDAFIKVIKMMIAPIIFCTVVVGIAKMGDMKEVGRVGLKAIAYFEIVTTLALVIGLLVVNIIQPGKGINADPAHLDAKAVAAYTTSAKSLSAIDFMMNIIPNNFIEGFVRGEVLQVLFVAVLFGLALAKFGGKAREGLLNVIDQTSHVLFGVIGMIMYFAPIGAFGAMAFTIGKYGIGSLVQLGQLMASVYITCFLFVVVVLGLIAKFTGFSIWKFLRYIKEEILIVLGTSSSESALPRLMAKLENAGCAKPVVGLVVPTGYSFNLDGTSIYLTMAALFIAQATNTDLTLGQQLTILAVLLLTSKGAAAVTGSGFVTLAATLSTIDTLPLAGIALLLGIDRFMSEARAITNLIGNGVATIVVAKWEDQLDARRLVKVLDSDAILDAEAPEVHAEGVPAPR